MPTYSPQYAVESKIAKGIGLYPVPDESLTRIDLSSAASYPTFTSYTISKSLIVNEAEEACSVNLEYTNFGGGAFGVKTNVGISSTSLDLSLIPGGAKVLGLYLGAAYKDSTVEGLISSYQNRLKRTGIWFKDFGNFLLLRFRLIYTDGSNVLSFETEFDILVKNDLEVEFRYSSISQTTIGGTYPLPISDFDGAFVIFDSNASTALSITKLPGISEDPILGGFRTSITNFNTIISTPGNIKVVRDWPAQGDFGAIYRFVPTPTSKAKILPRQLRRKLDSKPFPPPPDLFDDRRTVISTTGPANFSVGLPRLAGNRSTFGSVSTRLYTGVDTTGSISMSSIDAVEMHDNWPDESSDPYSETQQFEQNLKETQFYLTGTDYRIVGPGFEDPLGEKQILRFEMPVRAATSLSPTSASLYYYDSRTCVFVEAAAGSRQDPASSYALFSDAKMYSAFGTPVASGSTYWTNASSSLQYVSTSAGPYFSSVGVPPPAALPHPWVQGDVTQETINASYQHVLAENVMTNVSYSFSSNNVTPLTWTPPIDRPFLVEKITAEIPFKAGHTWFSDRTHSRVLNWRTAALDVDHYKIDVFDAGGPCVVFGLLREENPTNVLSEYRTKSNIDPLIDFSHREIIADSRIVPSTDISLDPSYVVSSSISESTCSIQAELLGFNSFYDGEIEGIVEPVQVGGQYKFTGAVSLNMTPRSVNCYYYSYGNNRGYNYVTYGPGDYNPTDAYGVGVQYFDLLNDRKFSEFQNLKPFSRSSLNSITDNRSVFGRQHQTNNPQFLDGKFSTVAKNPWYESGDEISAAIDDEIFKSNEAGLTPQVHARYAGVVRSEVQSPYLMMPGDKYTLFVSKHRPVRSGFTTGSNYSNVLGTQHPTSGSHDVAVNTGSIKFNIYGSYVKEGMSSYIPAAFTPTENVSLVIGDDPVLDQFENNSNRELIGSSNTAIMFEYSDVAKKVPLGRVRVGSSAFGRGSTFNASSDKNYGSDSSAAPAYIRKNTSSIYYNRATSMQQIYDYFTGSLP